MRIATEGVKRTQRTRESEMQLGKKEWKIWVGRGGKE